MLPCENIISKDSMSYNPLISVIINTRNRKNMLFCIIRSIYDTKYPKLDIIIVDDVSELDYSKELYSIFPQVRLIKNDKRAFLIKSRNVGWRNAKSSIVFFIDDDNEVDSNIFDLALHFIIDKNIGVLGCRTYLFNDKKRIIVSPNRFNKLTGKTSFIGFDSIDIGKYEGVIETHDSPNAFFIRKEVLEELNGFTEDIVQTFSEADFAERARNAGYKVVQFSGLKVYHKSPRVNFSNLSERFLGSSPERAYFFMRNRYIFIKRHANLFEKIGFLLIFSHLYWIYYGGQMFKYRKFEYIKPIILGCIDGIFYMVSNKLINRIEVLHYKE